MKGASRTSNQMKTRTHLLFSEAYLRWQLLTIKELLIILFGPKISIEKRIVKFNRNKKRLQRVFDTFSR